MSKVLHVHVPAAGSSFSSLYKDQALNTSCGRHHGLTTCISGLDSGLGNPGSGSGQADVF